MKARYKIEKSHGYTRLYEDDILVASEDPKGNKSGATKYFSNLDYLKDRQQSRRKKK